MSRVEGQKRLLALEAEISELLDQDSAIVTAIRERRQEHRRLLNELYPVPKPTPPSPRGRG